MKKELGKGIIRIFSLFDVRRFCEYGEQLKVIVITDASAIGNGAWQRTGTSSERGKYPNQNVLFLIPFFRDQPLRKSRIFESGL